MIIPVKIWITPSTREPIRIARVSFRGVNRAGSSTVLEGLMILAIWGIKSPKKPPVRAPKTSVLTTQRTSRPAKLRMVPRACIFLNMNQAMISMIRP